MQQPNTTKEEYDPTQHAEEFDRIHTKRWWRRRHVTQNQHEEGVEGGDDPA